MTPDQQLARELFMAEMWRPVRELSREERAVAAALAAIRTDESTAGDSRNSPM